MTRIISLFALLALAACVSVRQPDLEETDTEVEFDTDAIVDVDTDDLDTEFDSDIDTDTDEDTESVPLIRIATTEVLPDWQIPGADILGYQDAAFCPQYYLETDDCTNGQEELCIIEGRCNAAQIETSVDTVEGGFGQIAPAYMTRAVWRLHAADSVAGTFRHLDENLDYCTAFIAYSVELWSHGFQQWERWGGDVYNLGEDCSELEFIVNEVGADRGFVLEADLRVRVVGIPLYNGGITGFDQFVTATLEEVEFNVDPNQTVDVTETVELFSGPSDARLHLNEDEGGRRRMVVPRLDLGVDLTVSNLGYLPPQLHALAVQEATEGRTPRVNLETGELEDVPSVWRRL